MDELLLADREMDIMTVLWNRGSGTVAEVREMLADALAYNTVLTVLRTLERKGVVGHVEVGQAYRYVPLIERVSVRRSALQRLLDKLFSGTPEQLLNHMVDERSLSMDDLKRLRAQIEALETRIANDDPTSARAGPAQRPAKKSARRGRKP